MEHIDVQSLVEGEMKQIALAKIIKKSIFETLQKTQQSDVYTKFYNSKGKGKIESVQVKWQHFVVQEHEKDKSSRNVVTKRKGVTRKGHTYVKDVDVQTVVTHYDYLTVKDASGNIAKFRLVDLDLKKISSGQLVSLGWLYHKRAESETTDVIASGNVFGQSWNDTTQPSVIVHHSDTESGHELVFQGIASDTLFNVVHSNAIGWWHLPWVLATAFMFMGDIKSDAEVVTAFTQLGIGFSVSIGMSIAHHVKGGKMKAAFKTWLRGEYNRMAKVGADALDSAKSQMGMDDSFF